MTGPRRRDWPSPGKGLLLISALLVGSAVLRTGMQAGPALARELAGGSGSAEMESEGAAPVADAMPEDLQQLVTALQTRDRQIQLAESEISDRMKALELADAALQRRLAELVQAEDRLSKTLALADGAAEGDLTRLTGVYERMKPKEAAALFEEMAPEFAAGFLARMRPESAAQVMAGLSPRAAYTISVVLAGRNVGVPTE